MKDLELAREEFLNLVADATEFKVEYDGDCDEDGRAIMTSEVTIRTNHHNFDAFIRSLGFHVATGDCPVEVIQNYLAAESEK